MGAMRARSEVVEMSLTHFSKARAELALAQNVDDVKGIRDKAEALRAYVRQQGESLVMQNQCAEICLRAERRAGELLKESIEHTGGGDRKSVSDDRTPIRDLPESISRNQSSDWQRIADMPEERFEAHISETKAAHGELTTAGLLRAARGVHVSQATGESEWYTPAEYIAAAREVMGAIDCDPASSETANRTVGAKTFYTLDDNGLAQVWGKRVWMNPPYAQPLVSQFSEALLSRLESGEVEEACVLVNNATETGWFQSMLEVSAAVCFVKGRVRFLDTDGKPGAPLQGQAALYMGPNARQFKASFASFGVVLRK